MKTTCFCKRQEDIVIKDLDDIITRKVHKEQEREESFKNYAWNDRSIKILIDFYPEVINKRMTIMELCRKTGKSYSAVRNKVRRMGYHGTMRYL